MVVKISHVSNPQKFIKLYKNVKDLLTEEHKECLDRWSFKHLLNLPDTTVCTNSFVHLFSQWDLTNNCFNFKGHFFLPSEDGFAVILGMRCHGDKVLKVKEKLKAGFVKGKLAKKFFPRKGTVKWSDLEDMIKEQLSADGYANPEELVLLLTIYMFSTCLISMSSCVVPMFLFEYMQEFRDLWSYNWARLVYDLTMKKCKEVAIRVHSHNNGDSSNAGSPCLQGAPWVLLTWGYEILQPHCVSHLGPLKPRYFKWDLCVRSEREAKRVFANMDENNFQFSGIIPLPHESWVFIVCKDLAKKAYFESHRSPDENILGVSSALLHLMNHISRLLSRSALNDNNNDGFDHSNSRMNIELKQCTTKLMEIQKHLTVTSMQVSHALAVPAGADPSGNPLCEQQTSELFDPSECAPFYNPSGHLSTPIANTASIVPEEIFALKNNYACRSLTDGQSSKDTLPAKRPLEGRKAAFDMGSHLDCSDETRRNSDEIEEALKKRCKSTLDEGNFQSGNEGVDFEMEYLDLSDNYLQNGPFDPSENMYATIHFNEDDPTGWDCP